MTAEAPEHVYRLPHPTRTRQGLVGGTDWFCGACKRKDCAMACVPLQPPDPWGTHALMPRRYVELAAAFSPLLERAECPGAAPGQPCPCGSYSGGVPGFERSSWHLWPEDAHAERREKPWGWCLGIPGAALASGIAPSMAEAQVLLDDAIWTVIERTPGIVLRLGFSEEGWTATLRSPLHAKESTRSGPFDRSRSLTYLVGAVAALQTLKRPTVVRVDAPGSVRAFLHACTKDAGTPMSDISLKHFAWL